MGHYLGLDHVFVQFNDIFAASQYLGMADVNRFDGDQLADTPPSIGPGPFQGFGTPCGNPASVTVLKFPGPGAVDVAPDKQNVMDYFGCGTQRLTPPPGSGLRRIPCKGQLQHKWWSWLAAPAAPSTDPRRGSPRASRWRKRMGIEPTSPRLSPRLIGFEDRDAHQNRKRFRSGTLHENKPNAAGCKPP